MNTSLQTLAVALGITLILSTSVVSADPRHEGSHNRFMQFFDANADGTVTYEEFLGASRNRFERMDTDSNATISEDEFSSYMQARREERHKDHFERMDANKDGKVSKDEFLSSSQERAQRRFERMDGNNDGQLSSDELGPGKKHKPRFGKKIFSKLDTNGDGKVTQQESQAAWAKWFERMDSNGDKVVTADETKQARAKWRDKWND
jgi:Ca2+-binding EF-hand superfamily protein